MRSFVLPLGYRSVLAAAALTVASFSSAAMAGYVATTGTDVVLTPAGPVPGAQVGDTFATTTPAGTLVSYLPGTPADPQLTGADLAHYGYTLNGAVTDVTGPFDNVITYAGTYSIFYDVNLDGTPDASVSSGNFSIVATFTGAGTATLSGALQQTAGPSNPAFADLSYGGSPVVYDGLYTETVPGQEGTIQGTLTQAALVPEPTSLAALACVALPLAARRRRRA